MKHVKAHLNKVHRKSHTVSDPTLIRMAQCEKDGFPDDIMNILLSGITAEMITRYPDTAKLTSLIASKHNVTSDNVLLTTGSDGGIRLIFQTFVKVLAMTSELHFPMYEVYSKINDARLVTVPYGNDSTMKGMLDAFKPSVDLIALANPNSPVGDYLSKDDVIKLLSYGKPTLIDEAYIDFMPEAEDLCDLVETHDNLMLTRTLSKGLGGAGLRIGYIIASKDTIATLRTCSDCYPLSGIAIHVAEKILSDPVVITHLDDYHRGVIEMRENICKVFEKYGIDYRSSHGNWMHVAQDELMCNFFKNMDVKYDCVFPNSSARWIRFSLSQWDLAGRLNEFLEVYQS